MSIAKLLKQAEKADATRKRAETEAETAAKETEVLLGQALVLVTSVSDATHIMRLTFSKETRLLAWKKAVILLGVSAKSLPDYILIAKRCFSTTHKEWDVECDWDKKKELIIADCGVEDLDILYATFPDKYRSELAERFGQLADMCGTYGELGELYNKYEQISRNLNLSSAWDRNFRRFHPEKD